MARPRTQHNLLPAGKNELAGGALFEASDTLIPTPSASHAPSLTPAQDPTPAPGPPGMYTNVDLQRATRLALKLFVKGQKYGQANSALRKRALQARNLKLYYRSSPMECYYFCQQCENYFNMAGTTGPQRVSFAASFF